MIVARVISIDATGSGTNVSSEKSCADNGG